MAFREALVDDCSSAAAGSSLSATSEPIAREVLCSSDTESASTSCDDMVPAESGSSVNADGSWSESTESPLSGFTCWDNASFAADSSNKNQDGTCATTLALVQPAEGFVEVQHSLGLESKLPANSWIANPAYAGIVEQPDALPISGNASSKASLSDAVDSDNASAAWTESLHTTSPSQAASSCPDTADLSEVTSPSAGSQKTVSTTDEAGNVSDAPASPQQGARSSEGLSAGPALESPAHSPGYMPSIPVTCIPARIQTPHANPAKRAAESPTHVPDASPTDRAVVGSPPQALRPSDTGNAVMGSPLQASQSGPANRAVADSPTHALVASPTDRAVLGSHPQVPRASPTHGAALGRPPQAPSASPSQSVVLCGPPQAPSASPTCRPVPGDPPQAPRASLTRGTVVGSPSQAPRTSPTDRAVPGRPPQAPRANLTCRSVVGSPPQAPHASPMDAAKTLHQEPDRPIVGNGSPRPGPAGPNDNPNYSSDEESTEDCSSCADHPEQPDSDSQCKKKR